MIEVLRHANKYSLVEKELHQMMLKREHLFTEGGWSYCLIPQSDVAVTKMLNLGECWKTRLVKDRSAVAAVVHQFQKHNAVPCLVVMVVSGNLFLGGRRIIRGTSFAATNSFKYARIPSAGGI